MCYEAAVALSGGEGVTLAKSSSFLSKVQLQTGTQDFQQDAYIPGSSSRRGSDKLSGVSSRAQHRRGLLSCTQYEKETLPIFYRRFLRLKLQALKISDDQVIAQVHQVRGSPLPKARATTQICQTRRSLKINPLQWKQATQ
jgi:hypothetical protein